MAVLRKLNYCPECGTYVTFDYSSGAIYSAITWRCTRKRCQMSKAANKLDEWNEDYPRSIRGWMKEVGWIIPLWFYHRWAHWKIWQASR